MAIETKVQPTSSPLTPGAVDATSEGSIAVLAGLLHPPHHRPAARRGQALNKLLDQTGGDVIDLLQRALALYTISKEAVQDGKVVGIAEKEESLETQFVGF